MAEDLRELRISKQIPAKKMVAVVRQLYPKYDKTMQSKCERGDEYGIRIREDALEALYATFAPERLEQKQVKRSSGHKLKCRISCRLPDEVHEELLEFIKADGFKTMQDWLTDTVEKYIRRKRRARERRNKQCLPTP